MVATAAATATCLNWSHLVVVPPHQFPSNTLSSLIISSQKRNVLVYRIPSHDSFSSNKVIFRRRRRTTTTFITCSAAAGSLNGGFSNDSRFQPTKMEPLEPPLMEREEVMMIPASIEQKAKSVDLPISIRIIKRKKQQYWVDKEGFREVVGESTYCCVKKAFSSMVFIIREIQSYTLQMREILYYEDLKGILGRVQGEMNASFVWLFQQVFSHTPTLMVSVMILLANFTVYSMASNSAVAAIPPPALTEIVSTTTKTTQNLNQKKPGFDSSMVKSYFVSSSPIGGGYNNNGGNGKFGSSIASEADNGGGGGGDGSSSSLNLHSTIIPDEISQVSTFGNKMRGSQRIANEEELKLWNSIVAEASNMQRGLRDEYLDEETIQRLVSPVSVESEPEDYTAYTKTDIQYQLALSQEPKNPLLLFNYAQFLYLVVHDHDRAEEYFRRAIRAEPTPDAEALNHYANFLWVARKDLDKAEEKYLEAMAADPGNTYHAANYAHFLWSTGGDDTCYPLSQSSTPITTNEA